ncbi:MAG TPA: hypothetical protein VIJ75_22525 [Hanamia sp.]
MNEEQFNKFFRDKLSNYPSPVPDDMWERIQHKNKRRFFFWWFFGGILLISFATGYFVFQDHTNKYNNKDHVKIEKQKTGAGNNIDIVGKGNAEKNTLLPKEKRNNEIAESDTSKSSVKIVTTTPVSGAKEASVKSDLRRNYREQNAPYTSNKNSYTTKKQLPENKQQGSFETKTARQNNTPNETDSSAANDISHQKATTKNDSTARITNVVPVSPAKDSSKKNMALKNTGSQKGKTIIKKKNLFVTGYFSPAFAFNKFTTGNTNYPLSYLNRIYKIRFSYTAGVNIGKMFSKRFSAQTGILFTQVNMILQTIDSANFKIKGKYRNIDVPIIAGYNIGHGNFTTTIHAGMVFNLSASSQGSAIYDGNGNPVDIYKSSTGISLYFGLGFAKQLNKSINLFAEPYFIYRPSYITKPEIPFKEQIDMSGISFGLRYNF